MSGEQTGGRFALWEGTLPPGAAPPLHSHPQDETFYVLEGSILVWAGERGDGAYEDWLPAHERRCGAGNAVFVPADIPHTFVCSFSRPRPAEEFVHALAELAAWPWLQPPPDAPRIPADRMTEVERQHHVVRVGPPPPA